MLRQNRSEGSSIFRSLAKTALLPALRKTFQFSDEQCPWYIFFTEPLFLIPSVSVAAKKGTILAAMAATGPQRFTGSLSLLTGGLVQNGPESVKGAPLLGAAKRTLDGEDRSEIIKSEGKAPARVPQSGSRKVAPSSPPLTSGAWT